jgi:hypothetical protein
MAAGSAVKFHQLSQCDPVQPFVPLRCSELGTVERPGGMDSEPALSVAVEKLERNLLLESEVQAR